MEIRTYRVQKISRRNGKEQYYITLPKQFLENNNYPNKLYVVVKPNKLIVVANEKDLRETLDKYG